MKIGLGLIVKNEEADLPICLESFLPFVDAVVIVDTGSDDNTLNVAYKSLRHCGIPYQVVTYLDANDEQGRINNFSLARNQYIKLLEEMNVDYIMSADADDTLISTDLKQKIDESKADICSIQYRMDTGLTFSSYKIWRSSLKLKYIGRVHEYLNVDWSKDIKDLDVIVQHHYTSPENQENGTQRNLRILREEIYPPLRSLFYFANENIDAKNYDEAIKWYLEYIRRANEGEACWPVELAHCYFRAARWLMYLGKADEAISLSKELLKRDPSWSESWCELAYIAKTRGQWDKVQEYCARALSNQFKPRLFSEHDKYTSTPTFMLLEAKNYDSIS